MTTTPPRPVPTTGSTVTVYDTVVTARQPLALGTRPAGTAPTRTHRHIPGSVLRGALAAVWIAAHGTPNRLQNTALGLYAQFLELFEGAVRYEPLYAPGWQTVPMSVLRCKYPRNQQCADWVEDEAFPLAGSSLCPHCKHPGARSKGAVEPVHTQASAQESTRDLVSQTVRLQIDDATATAEHGLLFTREALRPRTRDGEARTFTGRITVQSGISAEALAWLTGPARHRLHLGGRRSTGGGADLQLTPVTRAGVSGEAREGTSSRGDADGPGVRRLALRLTSPALFTDPCGLPMTVPDTGELATLLGVPVTLTRSWTRHEHIGGWNAAANLPKPVELAASAGSTYLLDLADPPHPERLVRLADRGLGLRRTEGFGSLTIATTAWRPPPPPAAPAAAPAGYSDRDRVAAAARILAQTGHGAWFLNELRAYITARSQGAERNATLLDRPHLAGLTPGQRRTVEAIWMRPDHELPLLDAIRVHLEALLRSASTASADTDGADGTGSRGGEQ
ncbi:type III-B CRISPR module-associated Cmr3 family protein [Streptomyces sp. enrichment culture]|uniref:type III-B CRISPR module-associated Cmr3 family protein n=1 Tax=Streptomyces sp. enrichment culture TaxID=1795815 RepID=UPI003F55B86C